MTLQEAKKKVDETTDEVQNSISSLRSAANATSSVADEEANSNKVKKTFACATICILGLMLCLFSQLGLGVFLIIVGAFITYFVYGSGRDLENNVLGQSREFRSKVEATIKTIN